MNPNFIFERLGRASIQCATLWGLGNIGRAPGTNGSVAGILLYTVFLHPFSWGQILLLLVGLHCSRWICQQAERSLGIKDAPQIILDECMAMPLCFLGLGKAIDGLGSRAWVLLLAGFVLFRCFDIFKPFGIRKLQNLKGGWGILIDDVAAALASCVCLHFIVLIFFSTAS